ncbi:hypothetical protein BsWGS_02451 [Bradybaena similaris]
MKGSFTKRGRQCDVTVTKTQLKCTLKNNLGPDVLLEINLKDILAVQPQARESSSVNSFVVHYAGYKKDSTLTWEKLVLSGDPDLCKELTNIFSFALADRQRPRHFLVVINPNSGRKTGGRIFHKKVAPLFRACGITFKTYVTSGPKDGRNAFQDVDLSTLDGVIAVGGDGIMSEVLTAIVHKQQQIAGFNADDPDVKLPPIPFPVGFIPAGSGNYAVRYLHGSTDVVTAAIKIVLSQTRPVNVVSVHQGNKLEGMSHLLSSFGLIGDMMRACEKYRWMGNVRYKILPVRTIFRRRLIDAEVEYLKESTGDWHSSKGSFYVVDTNVCDLVDKDSKLVPMFADSALNLHMTSACSLSDHIKQLSKVAEFTAGAYNYDFIQVERVLKYRVHLPALESQDPDSNRGEVFYMNLDGEAQVINKPCFQVSLHHGILQVFGSTEH